LSVSSVPTGLRAATRYIPEVESLRGIAILLVLFHHADGLLTPKLAGGGVSVSLLRAFVAGGQTGVSLFFVLSAFCLSMPFFRRADEAAQFSLRTFYERRALRILPLYWTMVAIATLYYAGQTANLTNFATYALFLNSFAGWATPLPPFSNVWWSLATEVQFYLLLPLLPFVLRSPFGRWIGLAAAVLYLGWFVLFLQGSFPSESVVGEIALASSVLARGPIFLVGIAVAWIHARHGDSVATWMRSKRVLRAGGGDLLLLSVLVAMACLLQWQVGFGFWKAETRAYYVWHVAEGLLWGSMLFLLLAAPLRSRPLFCNRLLNQAGLWSYSIYLIHLPLLVFSFIQLRHLSLPQFTTWTPWSFAAVALLSVLCFALAGCTYRWIEKPFLVRKARLGD